MEIKEGSQVRLNKVGQKKHPKYPSQATYVVEKIFNLREGGCKLTLSCEECPNPKSATGMYYAYPSEVIDISGAVEDIKRALRDLVVSFNIGKSSAVTHYIDWIKKTFKASNMDVEVYNISKDEEKNSYKIDLEVKIL